MSKLPTEKPTSVEEEKVSSTMQSEKQPQPPVEEKIPDELASKMQEVIDFMMEMYKSSFWTWEAKRFTIMCIFFSLHKKMWYSLPLMPQRI